MMQPQQPTMPEMPQFTAEQSQAAQAQIQALLQEDNIPPEVIAEIGQWAQAVIMDPQRFPEFQAWLRSKGLDEEDIPETPDYQELASMVAMGHVAQSMAAEQPVPAAAPGAAAPAAPVNPADMQALAQQGTYGDTQLAHINPQEAAVLESMGGTGSINPQTGLPQYNFFKDLWRGVKKVAKAVAPFVLPVVAIAFPALIPAIGTTLGASAALAPVVGAAALAGGVTALSGGSVKEVLTSAALTGLGAYLTPIIGNYAGKLTGITNPTLLSSIGSAGFAAGITAVRGGSVGAILTAAATGAAASYLGTVASNAINSGQITNRQITQKTFDDAVFLAADAKGLADVMGNDAIAIERVLTSTGATTQAARLAAQQAVKGASADAIAVSISNAYGGMRVNNQPSLYSNNQTGVQNSIIGGANVKALESLQTAEDMAFILQDAKNLQAAGLNASSISQNLQAAGVDPKLANYVSQWNLVTADVNRHLYDLQDFATKNKITAPIGEARAVTTKYGTVTQRELGSAGTKSPLQQDADFIAQQYKDLQSQGLSRQQIEQIMTQEGVNINAVRTAHSYSMGTVESISNNLQQAFRDSSTPMIGAAQQPAAQQPTAQQPTAQQPTAQQPAAQQPAAQPVAPVPPAASAAPQGMSAEQFADYQFAAADAAQLRAQGLGTTAISQNLQAAGVAQPIANQIAFYANQGATADAIARTVAAQYGDRPVFTAPTTAQPAQPAQPAPVAPAQPQTNTGLDLTPAEYQQLLDNYSFVGADATQMAQQGLNQAAIEQNLIASGVNPAVARTAATAAAAGNSQAQVTELTANQHGYAVQIYGNATTVQPVSQPAAQPGSSSGVSVETDASFVAADAAQLAQQGLSQAAIEQNLLYAGVDPLVAADAAALAASGMNAATIQQNIEQSGASTTPGAPPTIFTPPGTPVEALPGYPGTPGAVPIQGGATTAPTQPVDDGTLAGELENQPDMVPTTPDPGLNITPVTPPDSVLNPEQPQTLTPGEVGAIVGTAPSVTDATTAPTQPTRPNMGTFTPAPPDPSWSIPLQYPGINPGLMGAAVQPAYQTTSPVQSQYYWGRQPFMAYEADLANYNRVALPQQPWGIQQGYFEQPLNLQGQPVFQPDLTTQPVSPTVRYGLALDESGNPLQIMPTAQTQAPMLFTSNQFQPVTAPVAPGNYVFNVAPQLSQYSVPAAAPITG